MADDKVDVGRGRSVFLPLGLMRLTFALHKTLPATSADLITQGAPHSSIHTVHNRYIRHECVREDRLASADHPHKHAF